MIRKTENSSVEQGQDMQSRIVFPMLPEPIAESDMAVYFRFMQHLHHVPSSRMEIKTLSAIQFTADILDHSDAHIAKILVDLGLRAPRAAFPADFLDFADACLMRSGWEVGGPGESLLELKEYWDEIGEDRFAGFKRQYSLLDEDIYAAQ